jgi:DNA-binding CsgD family transcriptional regulator
MSVQPMTATVLVGREADVAMLRERLHAASRGAGATMLISGEAGIGKSRLVAEISSDPASSADDIHVMTLRGHCFEHDHALPYAPILDLLRSWSIRTAPEEIAAHFGPDAAIFGALLPELATSPSTTAPEHEKHRIFHALLALFSRFARTQPLLIVIEDLHWSDDTSLEFLLHLARHVPTLPILLVLTYRSDEVTPSLHHTLALLDRERLATEIALPRLALPDIDVMLRAFFAQPQPIRADFLRAIHDLTDGNPFFIEEVIRSLIAAGDIFHTGGRWERRSLGQLHIPRSVQDAVTRRTRDLSAEANRIVRLAAVAGRFFDFAILQALTDWDENMLLELIRELMTAQLVIEESAERFAFRHALTRQAIYTAMLARERRVLHLAVAQAMERLHAAMPEPYFADLSYHFAAGESWEKAIEYGERAGERALALYAPQAAVEHFSRAADAAAHLSITLSARLYRERGRARIMLGDFSGALVDYQAALERVRADGDRLAEWQALLDLGGLWVGYDYARAGEYFDAALTLAEHLDNPAAVAESLMQRGGWYLNTERVDEAEASLQAALAIFEQTGDRRGIARSIDLLGTVSDIAGDIIQMRRRYERAASLFRELDDRQGLCSTLATMLIAGGAYIFETVVTPTHISVDDSMREFAEALALARDIGWRAGEAYVLLNQTLNLGSHGDYGNALACARDARAIAREIDHHEWMAGSEWIHGVILMDILALPLAQGYFERGCALAQESGSLHWIAILAGYLAESYVLQGDPGGAEDVLLTFDPDLPMRTLGQRRIWMARARIALAHGDAASAREIVESLFANAANLTGMHDIPLLTLLHSQCLMALNRHGEAEEPLRAALQVVIDRSLPALRWRLQVALGQVYTAQNRHADAHTQFQSASEIIDSLAASIPDNTLRDTFLRCAATLLPADRAIRARRDGNILTGRERDVAMLVVRGLSNREIADLLSIGERTVETHVGNILNKLGFNSRAQVAAWTVESGLRRAAE